MKAFIHYLSAITHIFLTTKSISILFYILNTCFLGLLGKASPFFNKKYINKASKFKEYVINTKHGKYLCSNFHDFLEVRDNYEPEVNDIIKAVTKAPNNYLINIGCNVGRWAIACAKIYGYKVIAFEPAPDTYHRLKINILLSDLEDNIEIYNVGLGDKNQKMKFDYVPQWNGGSKIIQDGATLEGKTIEVPVKKFDDLGIDKEKIDETRLIIMDVEGFEFQVIQGMEKALKEFHNINIIMEIWENPNKDNTINFMKNLGYSISQIDEANYLFNK